MTRVLSLLVALLLAAQQTPLERARQLQIELGQLVDALTPPPVASLITTPAELDAALVPGAVLTLDPALVYPRPLTVDRGITLRSSVLVAGRMTREAPAPRFLAGLTLGDGATVVGLEVRQTSPLTDLVIVRGKHVTVDRLRVLGDPVKGGKRGISANGDGAVQIVNNYVAEIFGPDTDTQALYAGDMGPGLVIENNLLSGGHESLLIGGTDPPSEARIPTDVTIRGNTITADPAQAKRKNALEIKNARNVLVEGNTVEYSWAAGQDGYLLVLTIRNQDGRAPFSTMADITIRSNTFTHGAGAINILGLDQIKESGANRDVPIGTIRRSVKGARWTITGNTFADLDPATYAPGKVSRMILIDQAPDVLTIDRNTFTGAVYNSAVYFAGGPPAVGFVFTNNTLPRSTYGLFGVGVSAKPHTFTAAAPAWVKYTSGGTIANITEAP